MLHELREDVPWRLVAQTTAETVAPIASRRE